jgi:hypothetical protein
LVLVFRLEVLFFSYLKITKIPPDLGTAGEPMRAVLRRERDGADMRNKVFPYGNNSFEEADAE